MTESDKAEMAAIKWWHRIDLGDGIITPGVVDSEAKLPYIHLPERMDGLRVLDVGAWDGWWSFLCERRGARVIAMDKWDFDTGSRGFSFAKQMLKSNVQAYPHNIEDADMYSDFYLDFVLCLGALHHFINPLLALGHMYDACDEDGTLILETHMDLLHCLHPACRFYTGPEVHNYPYNDPTILWGPNPACVMGWLKHAGFSSVEQVDEIPKAFENGGVRGVFHAKA